MILLLGLSGSGARVAGLKNAIEAKKARVSPNGLGRSLCPCRAVTSSPIAKLLRRVGHKRRVGIACRSVVRSPGVHQRLVGVYRHHFFEKRVQSWMDRRRLRGPELLRVSRRMSAEYVANVGSDVRPPTDNLSVRRATLSLRTPGTRTAGDRVRSKNTSI